MNYGYFVMSEFDDNKYAQIKNCVEKISNILSNLSSMVEYSDDSPGYYFKSKRINLCTIERYKQLDVKQISWIQDFIKDNVGAIDDLILSYWVILHEYGHSLQPFRKNEQYNSLKGIAHHTIEMYQAYRNIPQEKEADDFAFNFIKKHWDFLMS